MTTGCTVVSGDFRGWKGITLSNGLISLTAVPDIGGRVMAYDLGDYQFLYVDRGLAGKLFTPAEHMGPDGAMVHWKNYGGDKTWPSPQGWSSQDQWPGPPDAVLDSGRYTVTLLRQNPDGSAEIEMTSPPDTERTGIQIIRHFQIFPGSSRVRQTLTFRNVSQRTVRWSIWDVNQLRGEKINPDGSLELQEGCVMTTKLNPHSRFPRGFYVMFADEKNPQWQVDRERGLFTAEYLWEIGKVGIDSVCGWIGFTNRAQKVALAEQYTVFEGQEYPDQGVSLECWTVGRGSVSGLNYEGSGIYLMEAEVLSPLYVFQPGDSRSFTIEWGSCGLNGMLVDVHPGGATAAPLAASPAGEHKVHLTGQFGVFDLGRLLLQMQDSNGQTLVEQDLGPVSPLQPLNLDIIVDSPTEAAQFVLLVQQSADGASRLLARLER